MAASTLGWWVIAGEDLLSMLREVADGADPDIVYAEHYVNSDHHDREESDE